MESPLLTLPNEVRLLIFRYIFEDARIVFKTERRRRDKLIPFPEDLMIFLVCRQLHQDPVLHEGFASGALLILENDDWQEDDYLDENAESLMHFMGSHYFPMIKCRIPSMWSLCEPKVLTPTISILSQVRELHQKSKPCCCWTDKRIDRLLSVQAGSSSGICDHPSYFFINHYLNNLPRPARTALVKAVMSRRLKLVIDAEFDLFCQGYSRLVCLCHLSCSLEAVFPQNCVKARVWQEELAHILCCNLVMTCYVLLL